MNITFGLVVYHEQELIQRCLESIKHVADEIIVIHDGPCSDQTMTIARKYTDKVWERERLEGSDPHRLYILEQSRNNWVFMIDADEFLSANLHDFLKNATLDESLGGYAFKWPLWDGNQYVTHTNYRACLFNRENAWAVGLHNFSIQSVAEIKKVDLVLEHQPRQNKVSFKRFSGQLKTRLGRDARAFLQTWEQIPKYNESKIPVNFKNWYQRYTSHPGVYAWLNLFRFFLGTWRNNWRDGYYGFVVSTQAALYQYRLARAIMKLKNQ